VNLVDTVNYNVERKYRKSEFTPGKAERGGLLTRVGEEADESK